MKKKMLCALSVALCLSSLCGCGSAQITTFSAPWNLTSVNTVVPNTSEKFSYSVNYEPNGSSYVQYQNGKYVVDFSVDPNDASAYLLKSEFTVSVSFSYGGASTEWFSDSIVSEVKILSAANGLQPVSSKKTVVSHSPTGERATSLKCYDEYNYSIETTYKENGRSGVCKVQNNGGKKIEEGSKKFSASKDYSYLDNEELIFALRAISSSTTVQTYNASTTTVQKIKASIGKKKDDKFTFKLGEETAERTISYAPISLSISERNPGGTQTVWVARNPSQKNTYRNMILKMETPLSYNLGKFVYTLASATVVSE